MSPAWAYTDDQVIAAIEDKLFVLNEEEDALKAAYESASGEEKKAIRFKLFIIHVREKKLNYFAYKVPYLTDHQIDWLVAHYHLVMNVSPHMPARS